MTKAKGKRIGAPTAGWSALRCAGTVRFEDLTPAIQNIARLLGPPSDWRLRDMVERGGSASRIGYDRDALEFNRAFFLRNAVKCLTISRIISGERDDFPGGAVLDVGGGIGTFALCVADRRPLSDIAVVDRSPAQIALGRRVVSAACKGLNIRWIVSDEIPPVESKGSMALFSFSLCESPHLLTSSFERGWRTALVVDYPEIVDQCAAFAARVGARFIRKRVWVTLCPELAGAVGQTTVSVDGGMFDYD